MPLFGVIAVAAALRLLRRIVGLKDDAYYRHITRYELFAPVVECYRRNGDAYNLLNSAMLELFEYIRTDNVRPLLVHVGKLMYEPPFRDVTYVDTFKQLRIRYEQFAESTAPLGATPQRPPTAAKSPEWTKREDEWFNEDDDEWDDDLPHVNMAGAAVSQPASARATSIFHRTASMLQQTAAEAAGGAPLDQQQQTPSLRRTNSQLIYGPSPPKQRLLTGDERGENAENDEDGEQQQELDDEEEARYERNAPKRKDDDEEAAESAGVFKAGGGRSRSSSGPSAAAARVATQRVITIRTLMRQQATAGEKPQDGTASPELNLPEPPQKQQQEGDAMTAKASCA